MGHKGVSKRKKPQIKLKVPATANRGAGAVSGLAQATNASGQSPAAAGGKSPASGSKKKNKKR